MKNRLIVFTDLDGTLLDPVTYECPQRSLEVIAFLQENGHFVIPVTSKTVSEMRAVCEKTGIKNGFSAENGSFTELILGNIRKVIRLGGMEGDVKKKFSNLKTIFDDNIVSTDEMPPEMLKALTGLQDVKAMLERNFSVVFTFREGISLEDLRHAALKEECQIVKGDRFHHLISLSAEKGKAVSAIKDEIASIYSGEQITTLAFGNSENDISMLEAVEHPFVIYEKGNIKPLMTKFPPAVIPTVEGWHRTIEILKDAFFKEET
ncbi:MAG TPA: HAD hydrolase family protein [bacterium]|nr:HAD hydrolase family protein [bacterium]